MKRNKVKEFFGFKFVYNTRSFQIHSISNLQKNCNFESMRNGIYCTKRKALTLIKEGDRLGNKYDGCIHCWKQMNNHGKN